VNDQSLIGLPATPPPLSVDFILEAHGRRVTLSRAVDFAWNDPVAGERRRPLEILPPVTLDPIDRLLVFTDARKKELRVKLTATVGAVEGELRAQLPPGWSAVPDKHAFSLAKKSDEAIVSFQIQPGSGSGKLAFRASVGGNTFSTGIRRIEYAHLPMMTLSPPAEVKLSRIDLKRAGNRIGYIPGAGDEVAAALRQAGYDVTTLSDDKLAQDPLKFDAIVVGVRAYNVNPRLPQLNQRLFDYVKNGGTVLCQYNTQNRFNKLTADIGPYPFHISQDRVTDENAAVTLADHPLLKAPNAITAADFNGWVQERGLYFADKWDEKYQPLVTMNDPGETPKKGALLVAKHGKGRFIYTGLAFFRQLPAGVPGAFRLFANLIAHGK
jgi:hypothetical protein